MVPRHPAGAKLGPSFGPARLDFANGPALTALALLPNFSRALIFESHGSPSEIVKALTYDLPKLNKGEVTVKFELGAVNPADINVLQGVYPSQPKVREELGPSVRIMGNEGVGTVVAVAEGDEGKLKVGDTVVMGSPQLGTWQSHGNLPSSSLIPLHTSLTYPQAATLSINPPTALRMLSDYVDLRGDGGKGKKKQWVIQNGANSAVGQAVIQIAKKWGVGTINLVRSRDDFSTLESYLKSLGADHVLTYDEFLDRESGAKDRIKQWVGEDGGEMRLALNCVGGKETSDMVKLLGLDGKLVTYGGMAKQPLAIPPSLFIFKKLTTTGFWLTNWLQTHPEARVDMINDLAKMVARGELREPETEVVELSVGGREEEVAEKARETLGRVMEGRGRKVLFKWV